MQTIPYKIKPFLLASLLLIPLIGVFDAPAHAASSAANTPAAALTPAEVFARWQEEIRENPPKPETSKRPIPRFTKADFDKLVVAHAKSISSPMIVKGGQ
jgi:hypothetical protein